MLKNFIILSVFTLFLSHHLFSQNDSTVAFVAYWEVGDTRFFKITKSKKKSVSGQKDELEEQSYIARLSVIDATDTTYTLTYKFENPLIKAVPILKEAADFFTDYEEFSIVYQTDEYGDFMGIVNWQEISDMIKEFMEDAVIKLDDGETDVKAIMSPILEVFTSKDGIESLVAKELNLIHTPFGAEYNEADTLEYEDLLPNLFGGDPIPTMGIMYFDSVNYQTNYASFVNSSEINSSAAKKMVTDMMEAMVEKAGSISEEERIDRMREIEKVYSDMVMEIRDYNVFEYWYYPGWPKRIKADRIVNVANGDIRQEQISSMLIEEVQ